MRGWRTGAAALALGTALLVGCGGEEGGDDDASETSTSAEAAEETSTSTSTTEATTTSTTEATTTTTTEAPTTPPPADAPGTKPWQDLGAGECIGTLPTGTFTEVTTVDCATPHAAEALTAIRAVQISGGDADASAQATCDQQLATVPAASGRAATYILETQGTLVARAVCLVVDPGGAPMTGSVVAG